MEEYENLCKMGYNERLEYCFKQMQPFGYTAEEIDGAARQMLLTGRLVYPSVPNAIKRNEK